MAMNAVALLPEVTIRVANVNDDAFHWVFIQRGIDALERGENLLEFWVPQLAMGFPQFLYYQHLPHVFVILLYEGLFRTIDAYTLFNLVRYLLLVTFPITVFWSLRRMDLSPAAAAAGAAASSLLSTPYLYGFDYDSYLWRGFGMYTQLWAMHLSFLTLACFHRLITRGTGFPWAVLSLSALALSHILYAYMAAITLAVLFVVHIRREGLVARAVRCAAAGLAAAAVTAYMWVPAVQSGQLYLDVSPYLEQWKYDSFGAPTVLGYLVGGRLFDEARWPVLTVLAGVGVVASLVHRTRATTLAVALFGVWLVLFFGRPTLGPIADLFPLDASLYFHRFIGGVHLGAIMLIGIGGGWIYERLDGRTTARLAIATAALVLLLVPALAERWGYAAQQTEWMSETSGAIAADRDAEVILAALAALPPGRVYAGKPADWGDQLAFGIQFNSVKMRDLLTFSGIPTASIPYSGPSLNADLLYDFDAGRPADYDVFDARYVIAPTGRPMPSFLRPLTRTGRYTLYEAPTTGYAGLVAITDRRAVSSQAMLFPQNRAWLAGPDPGAHRVIRWDYPAAADRSLGEAAPGCADGRVGSETVAPGRVELIVECATDATLEVKVTYHPNWHVYVDGGEVETFMVSPSYVGVSLPAGRHGVVAEYRSTPEKAPLLALGALALAASAAVGVYGERRRWWTA